MAVVDPGIGKHLRKDLAGDADDRRLGRLAGPEEVSFRIVGEEMQRGQDMRRQRQVFTVLEGEANDGY